MAKQIVVATLDHARELEGQIRDADKMEVEALGVTVQHALEHGVRSEAYAFLVDDDLICIFGLNRHTLLSGKASPWMLTSTAVEKHKTAFLRASRTICQQWMEESTSLSNYVDARHIQSILWLHWLGFSIHQAEMLNGHLFHYFDWVKR